MNECEGKEVNKEVCVREGECGRVIQLVRHYVLGDVKT